MIDLRDVEGPSRVAAEPDARPSWRQHVAVLPLAALGAFVALLAAHRVYAHGSTDLDELGYLSQAEALSRGHLMLPAAGYDPWFRPWLTGLHDGHVVFKYQPLWPALLAAAKILTGSWYPAIGLLGAAVITGGYAFAFETTRSRRVAAFASLLVCVSPFFVAQTGTYLPYAPSAALLLFAGAALLHAQRVQRRGWYAGAGALWGLAFFHRSFDAMVFGVPFAIWWLWKLHRQHRARAALSWTVAGFTPPLVLFLGYNAVVSGNPLKPAFTATGSLDTFGFGTRVSFIVGLPPTGPQFRFTPARSWQTTLHSLHMLPLWVTGGMLTFIAAAAGVVAFRLRSETWLLAALPVAVIVGYFFWWGTWNADQFHLYDRLGPFYWFPLLAPIVILAALGVEALASRVRWRPVGSYVLAGGLLLGVTALSASDLNTRFRFSETARVHVAALLHPPSAGLTLLLTQPAFPGDPYVRTVVPGRLSARHLVALLPTGNSRVFELIDRFPGRQVFIVQTTRPLGSPFGALTQRVVPVRVVSARVLDITLTAIPLQPAPTVTFHIRVGNRVVDTMTVACGRRCSVRLRLRPEDLAGTPGSSADTVVTGGWAVGRTALPRSADWFERQWLVQVSPGAGSSALRLLMPGEGQQRAVYPNGLVDSGTEDTSRVLQVQVP